MRVLVVDDNEDLRRLMASALGFGGHHVFECAGGGEARTWLASNRLPDAIVLDVQMPVVDGWDTLAAIRAEERTSAIPVVMCTVKSRGEDMARGWEIGCDGYLVKPFDLDEFVREVEVASARTMEEREMYRREMLARIEAEMAR